MMGLPILAFAAATVFPDNPLRVCDGRWAVTIAGKTDSLENRCSGTTADYACDQVLNGKPIAHISFHFLRPDHYTTEVKLPDGSVASTGELQTAGDLWLWTSGPGKSQPPLYTKTENVFRDRNHIHFATYDSPDGKTWTKHLEGDEVADRPLACVETREDSRCLRHQNTALHGIVMDFSGAVIPKAEVTLRVPGQGFGSATDENSCFHFETNVSTADLEVSSPGFASERLHDIALQLQGLLRVTLSFGRHDPVIVVNSVRLTGLVVDQSGAFIPNATVRLLRDQQELASTTTAVEWNHD